MRAEERAHRRGRRAALDAIGELARQLPLLLALNAAVPGDLHEADVPAWETGFREVAGDFTEAVTREATLLSEEEMRSMLREGSP